MGMIVQHNLTSMNANRNLGVSCGALAKSTEKLSSGYKINRAGDNAAGLAISEKMRGQIRGLNQASSNAEDGISLIQTAEGALTETHSILQRMRELAVQSASDTNTDDDRKQIQNEIDQLTQEVDRIANTTEFNTKKLLDGSCKGSTSQVDGTSSVEGTFTNGIVNIKNCTGASLVTVDDVVRITLKADITGDFSTGTVVSDFVSIETLNGISSSVRVTALIGDGVVVEKIQATGATISTAVTDVSFTISGATNLKAGDVITITLGTAVASKASESGKEALRLQVGANAGQEVFIGIDSMKAKDLGIVKTSTSTTDANDAGTALDVTTQSGASMAIESYDKAIQTVSASRAKMGAMQNRLEHTIANLDTSAENLQSAESSLRDTDMAEEMTNYSKNNILMQAGQSMLAQANQSNQGVLSLLQ